VIPFRSKRFVVVVLIVIAAIVFLLPAFVAFRYTAPEQRGQFATHPWRGWSFAYAALAVPTHSQLKTSGMALRKADWIYKGTVIDPREVQLLFVPKAKPYTFVHSLDGRSLTSTATPTYRFMWQVWGVIESAPSRTRTLVALLDYKSGRVLYDVRDDLPRSELAAPAETPSPSPSAP
jgi:hypothetical protein